MNPSAGAKLHGRDSGLRVAEAAADGPCAFRITGYELSRPTGLQMATEQRWIGPPQRIDLVADAAWSGYPPKAPTSPRPLPSETLHPK